MLISNDLKYNFIEKAILVHRGELLFARKTTQDWWRLWQWDPIQQHRQSIKTLVIPKQIHTALCQTSKLAEGYLEGNSNACNTFCIKQSTCAGFNPLNKLVSLRFASESVTIWIPSGVTLEERRFVKAPLASPRCNIALAVATSTVPDVVCGAMNCSSSSLYLSTF